ncbi:uncharacterized protein BDZ99DRAFT_459077 [Mytilinidion resinicola]|uniref:Uncharacterized protein n=1 Tax=Mytilinidion resinicola TaxID=574789 RepID=A0A6A6Z4N3_9PEZI|nr:uncharacterized protein BDZ99DRAFT_459077 [Mytilinidion resinicola]KAF2815135.1 hypothetical protein BDZ99DRAFT_459077 [Mytilinidion resinicola]
MSLACTSLSFVLLEDVQKFFNENSAQTPSYERIDEKFPLLQQVLLPIWDWYGNYAFQAGRAYLEGLVSLEHHMKSITRLAQFLTSPKNLPWITATLHTYGQHDLSVLFTRIGLCVALSKDVDISGDNLAIWRVLFPDSIDFWLSEFYTLAKRLKWRFRFYEVVRNGEIFSNETTVSETGDDGLLGPYSLEILSTLENWSFPEYGYYDDYGIHFSGHEENDEKVSEVIDKALESHVSNAMSEGNGGIAPSGSESDEADAFAHRLRPDLKNAETSQTYVRARQLFRDGEWDLWWFSYKTGKIYQRLGRCRGFPG